MTENNHPIYSTPTTIRSLIEFNPQLRRMLSFMGKAMVRHNQGLPPIENLPPFLTGEYEPDEDILNRVANAWPLYAYIPGFIEAYAKSIRIIERTLNLQPQLA